MSIINTALIQKLRKIKADKTNVLELDQSVPYIPTDFYHPATKKYVDDQILSINELWDEIQTVADTAAEIIRVYQSIDNVDTVAGHIESIDMLADTTTIESINILADGETPDHINYLAANLETIESFLNMDIGYVYDEEIIENTLQDMDTFTFPYDDINYVDVFYNGKLLSKSDWYGSADKQTISLYKGVDADDDVIAIRTWKPFALLDAVKASDVDEKIQDAFDAYGRSILAKEVSYDNSIVDIGADNIQEAFELMEREKIDARYLPSTFTMYPTTTQEIENYFRLVTDVSDEAYHQSAVTVYTPQGTSLEYTAADDDGEEHTQLLMSFISPSDMFAGSPGIISIPVLFNVMRQNNVYDSGDGDYSARFYYKFYKRTIGDVEEYIGTSRDTLPVQPYDRPTGGYKWEFYSTTATINMLNWTADDRIVIKLFANTTNSSLHKCAYQFQFGGADPKRFLLPIPYQNIFATSLEYEIDLNVGTIGDFEGEL